MSNDIMTTDGSKSLAKKKVGTSNDNRFQENVSDEDRNDDIFTSHNIYAHWVRKERDSGSTYVHSSRIEAKTSVRSLGLAP